MNDAAASAVLARASRIVADIEAAGIAVHATITLRIDEAPPVPGTPRAPRPDRRRRLTPELLDDVAARRAAGDTVRQIAEHYGISLRNANRWTAAAAARNGSSS